MIEEEEQEKERDTASADVSADTASSSSISFEPLVGANTSAANAAARRATKAPIGAARAAAMTAVGLMPANLASMMVRRVFSCVLFFRFEQLGSNHSLSCLVPCLSLLSPPGRRRICY